MLRGIGRREASSEGGRKEELPCPGRRVISGEISFRACGHGLKERGRYRRRSLLTYNKIDTKLARTGQETSQQTIFKYTYLYIRSTKKVTNVE